MALPKVDSGFQERSEKYMSMATGAAGSQRQVRKTPEKTIGGGISSAMGGALVGNELLAGGATEVATTTAVPAIEAGTGLVATGTGVAEGAAAGSVGGPPGMLIGAILGFASYAMDR